MGEPSRRARRLLRLLYREDVRRAAYRAYLRRARHRHLRKMLTTFLQVEARLIGLLEGHLQALGVSPRTGIVRRWLGLLGGLLGGITSRRGDAGILRRIRSEESRGAERYAAEVDWKGWSPEERWTVDGHRCDQLYQNQWAEDVERDLAGREAG
ncbi:MAG: hypothetical protein PVF68_17470 [Acidobacteriota bacterium]